jgi:peptidoglycan hydrolase-like protein with peptidoglycan-binding domain
VVSIHPTALRASRPLPRVLAGLLVLALGLLLQAGSPPGSASAAPTPPPAQVVPSGIEDLASYVAANSCSPTTRPGTAKLGTLLVTTYPGTSFGGARGCGATPDSEHHDGRAVDWMNSVRNAKQKEQAEAVIAWLFARDDSGRPYANARRLGVMYVIWDNHIWGAYRSREGWREYNGCTAKSKQGKALDSVCHRNHMHLSLSWAGAMGRTSYWTGEVAAPDYGPCRPVDMSWASGYTLPNPAPCPRVGAVTAPKGASKTLRTIVTYSGRSMEKGSRYPAVKAVQKAIGARRTGTYSSATVRKMKTWQRDHDLEATGELDYATWRALRKALAP